MKKNRQGLLEVICGSMFSGKSEELIRRLKRSKIAQKNVIAFKHGLDSRKSLEYVQSHDGSKIKAYALNQTKDILKLVTKDIDVIGIDEVQFFPNSIVEIILNLVDDGKNVIVAGLDMDFRGIPFGPMPALLAFADKIIKLKAVCMQCGETAHFSQRILNGKPAKYSDPIIMIGADEYYQARCRKCFVIDRKPHHLDEVK